jgi:hypothetical protein
LSLSWAKPIQSTPPQPISKRSILILSTHLRLGLPSGLYNILVVLFSNNSQYSVRDTNRIQVSPECKMGLLGQLVRFHAMTEVLKSVCTYGDAVIPGDCTHMISRFDSKGQMEKQNY